MAEPLKAMYNQQYIKELAAAIRRENPAFDAAGFIVQVFDDDWEARQLKARMRHITTVLNTFLPPDYHTALGILRRAAPELSEYEFQNIVFPDYVELRGLDDWNASIPALEQFTQQGSAEFAIRPFIVRYQDRTMAKMLDWAQHKAPTVRRLASEGCRPRLPWAIALPAFKADPAPILPILEGLKFDSSESVRRSVANNLNDISKDNPAVVIDLLRRWQVHDTVEIQRITSHGLRSLLKQGHSDALELLGFPSEPAIAVHNLTIEPQAVKMGDSVTFSFEITSLSDQPQKLLIDYVLHLMRAKGKQTPKVFKLSKKAILPGQTLSITKSHSFAPITTRRYYPGEHAVEPQINGKLFDPQAFLLYNP